MSKVLTYWNYAEFIKKNKNLSIDLAMQLIYLWNVYEKINKFEKKQE